MKTHGFIQLSRKQFAGDDDLWDDGTPFDSRSAWTWLIQQAAWKDSTYHTEFRLDALKRGEFVASLRYLGERWGWDKMRVSRYLKMLEKARRVVRQRTGHHGTVYLLVKYDTYNPPPMQRETGTETVRKTIMRQKRDKVEEGKEGKEELLAAGAVGSSSSDHTDQPLPAKTTWVAVLGDDWKELTGGLPNYAKLGAQLKAAYQAYGLERVRAAWRRFCASEQRKYGPTHFAEHFGDYEPQSVSGLDEGGVMRALGITS